MHLRVEEKLCKPDLLLIDSRDLESMVIEGTITADNVNLTDAFDYKLAKYAITEVIRSIAKDYNISPNNTIVRPVVINYRGAVSGQSAAGLQQHLTQQGWKLMSVRTLQYSLYVFDLWNGSTAVAVFMREEPDGF